MYNVTRKNYFYCTKTILVKHQNKSLPYFLIEFPRKLFFFEFGNLKSQYIRPKVTLHKWAETIQGRKLFMGGNYMRKYGMFFSKGSVGIYRSLVQR